VNPFTCLGHAREIVVAAALCAGRLREFLSKDSVLTIQEDASSYRATRFSGGGLNCSRTHIGVHSPVKKHDLEKALKRLGWQLLRHGGNHDVWTEGDRQVAIPRHSEIHERLARGILKRARRQNGR